MFFRLFVVAFFIELTGFLAPYYSMKGIDIRVCTLLVTKVEEQKHGSVSIGYISVSADEDYEVYDDLGEVDDPYTLIRISFRRVPPEV